MITLHEEPGFRVRYKIEDNGTRKVIYDDGEAAKDVASHLKTVDRDKVYKENFNKPARLFAHVPNIVVLEIMQNHGLDIMSPRHDKQRAMRILASEYSHLVLNPKLIRCRGA